MKKIGDALETYLLIDEKDNDTVAINLRNGGSVCLALVGVRRDSDTST